MVLSDYLLNFFLLHYMYYAFNFLLIGSFICINYVHQSLKLWFIYPAYTEGTGIWLYILICWGKFYILTNLYIVKSLKSGFFWNLICSLFMYKNIYWKCADEIFIIGQFFFIWLFTVHDISQGLLHKLIKEG